MNLVDSSGWIEYLTRGSNGAVFLPVINDTQNLIVPTIVIYEVFKRALLLMGFETALEIAGVMSLGHEIPLDRDLAIAAASISVELKLAMADSLILATARAYDATLWTQDAHFKDIEGVRYQEKLA
jgi:predicted nucleic acid-binding protein